MVRKGAITLCMTVALTTAAPGQADCKAQNLHSIFSSCPRARHIPKKHKPLSHLQVWLCAWSWLTRMCRRCTRAPPREWYIPGCACMHMSAASCSMPCGSLSSVGGCRSLGLQGHLCACLPGHLMLAKTSHPLHANPKMGLNATDSRF